jgi:hypothetical protein
MRSDQILKNRSFWKISLGEKGKYWKSCLEQGVIEVGDFRIDNLGDYKQYSSKQDLKDIGMSSNSATQFWDFIDVMKVGDIVFSYASNHILGMCLVKGNAFYSEYNNGGESYIREVNWKAFNPSISIHNDPILWKGPFTRRATVVKLKDFEVKRLLEVLGNNSINLVKMIKSLDHEKLHHQNTDCFDDVDEHFNEYSELDKTERNAIIKSRIGQGLFRERIITLWDSCSVTGITKIEILKASHIKPWSDSSNNDRLNPYNGLLLIPNLDTLFDQGFITFDDDGNIIISDRLSDEDRKKLNISSNLKLRKVPKKSIKYLKYHRANIFISSNE